MGLRRARFDRAQRRPMGMKVCVVAHLHPLSPPRERVRVRGTFGAMALPINRRIDHAQRGQAWQV